MKKLLLVLLALAGVTLAELPKAKTDPLTAFLGHWEGSGKFYETKMGKAGSVTSLTDCKMSPQGGSMVCEQLISDAQGKHTQLTIYTPNEKDGEFTYYSFSAAGKAPYMGTLTIQGTLWTYGGMPDAAGKYPEFKTVNTVKDGEETFKVEFTEDGKQWTTMAEGAMRRKN